MSFEWGISVESASGSIEAPDSIEVNGVVYKREDKVEESAMQPKERKKLEAGRYEKGRKAGREELQEELRALLGLSNYRADHDYR